MRLARTLTWNNIMSWYFFVFNYLTWVVVQLADPTESKQHHEILKYGIPDQGPLIRVYENHILSYDQAKKTPIWVAEYITKKNTNGKLTIFGRSLLYIDSNMYNNPSILQCKSGFIRGVTTLVGGNLVVFYYLRASEIWGCCHFISWWSVLLVEETEYLEKTTDKLNFVLSTPCHEWDSNSQL
jgi:hypothetical protein